MTDTLDFKTDGTVKMMFNDTKITLARPNLKQYRALTELAIAMRDDLIKIDEVDSDAVSTVSQVNELLFGWISQVFEELGDKKLPDEDELPPWIIAGDLSRQLIEHWQAIPSPRGAP
jgi:hypothetical protein